MSEENNRWESHREYLRSGQTIRLSSVKDGENGQIWQILSVLGEGASAVCYEAVCADEEGETLGVLKEFYPISTRSGDRVWSYSMKRQASGQLVPCGISTQSFAALREEYIDAYRKLQTYVHAERAGEQSNKILNNYIQDARILYGCLDGSSDAEGAYLPSVYIWSRALHGVSFEQYLDEVRKAPWEESDKKLLDILETVYAVTDSIKAIHEAGLLHLDIKPSNFLVLYDSSHRLMPDHISLFDIDTMHPVGGDFPVKGTDGYAAPEIRRGETALCWADIYSIGAMLFHAVVMMEPGAGELPDDLYHDRYYKNMGYYVNHSQLIRGAQSNSDVRLMALLVRILRKCLAFRWEDRYGSCEEILEDLEKAIGRLRLYTLPAGALGPDEQVRVVPRTVDTSIVMQKLLYRYPVQENVLVVGAGTYGQKFMDQCLQAGQSKDMLLKIRALSDTPEEDAAMYLQFRPALTDFTRVTVDGERIDTAMDGSVISWKRKGQERSGEERAAEERPGQGGPDRERLESEHSGRRENSVCYARIDFESFVVAETGDNSGILNEDCVRALLNSTVSYDCIFIALGEDTRNRKIAELFAKALTCKGISCPVCYVCEQEPENLRESESGNLHPVWVNEPLTPGQISPSLERMAFQTHLCWDRSPNRDISDIYEKFIKDKYNYASSMAYALSIKAKLRSVGIAIESEDEEGYRRAARQFQAQILDHLHSDKKEEEKTDQEKEAEEKFAVLVALEHRRWLMEKAADGWRAPKYRNGERKYADCIVRGKVKDEVNHIHPCMVPCTEKMPLSQESYQRNHHEKWEDPDDPDRTLLDPLDRMSIELHQCFANYAASFRQSAPIEGGDMGILRQLILPQEEKIQQALRQYEFCLQNILNGVQSDSRQYDRWERNLLETAKVLDEERRAKIEERVLLIRKAFFPVIESNLYRDYKANDEIQIRMLPLILTGQFPVRSLAVSFANVAATDADKDRLLANIASVDILAPKQIYYLKYVRDDAEAASFLQNLRQVFAYLDRRAIQREVSVLLVTAKEGDGGAQQEICKNTDHPVNPGIAAEASPGARREEWRTRLARELSDYEKERAVDDQKAAKLIRCELCECENEVEAARQFARWLKEYEVRWLDDSERLFERKEVEAADGGQPLENDAPENDVSGVPENDASVDASGVPENDAFVDASGPSERAAPADVNRILEEILSGENIAAFRFDRQQNRFTDCRGCRELLYIEDSSYIRIDDYQSLTGERVELCEYPEYENDCEGLWNLYETAPDAWETLCGMLFEYETYRPALAILQVRPSGEENISCRATVSGGVRAATGESGALSGESGALSGGAGALSGGAGALSDKPGAAIGESGAVSDSKSGVSRGEEAALAEELAEFHTCFLPDYTYRTLERLLVRLKEYGVIGYNSSIRRYASDTCMLTVICAPATWQDLYCVLRKPQQLIDYYGVTAEKAEESNAEIRIVGNPLEVREMKAVFGEADQRKAVLEAEAARLWRLLAQLQDAGYILDLCVDKDTPDRMVSKDTPVWSVSFSYSSLRIKELLTTRGALQAVHAYYEILKEGYADDVRYIKPAGADKTMSGLRQAPEVLFSKGYQIFRKKVR